MKYRVNHVKKNFAKACYLSSDQEKRLKAALAKAYKECGGPMGINIDEINAFIAPYIKTPEEGFYVGQVIITDVWGAMDEGQIKNNFNINVN